MLLLLAACSENEIVAKNDPPAEDAVATAPDLVVEPSSVAFGEIAWDGEGVAALVLSNVGDAALHLSALSLAGGSEEVAWTAITSPVVPPGGSIETVLTWTPTSGNPLDDTLLVDSDDPDEPRIEVPLSGSVPAGDLVVEPALHDFGTVMVGSTASTVVTVSNVGDGPLTITSASYAANDGDLGVADYGALASLPYRLAPGASTEVVVTYTPSDAGGDEGLFSVVSDDPDQPRGEAEQLGNGEVDDPCDGFTQTVDLFLTADDAWQGWLDNVEFNGPGQNAWNQFDTFTWEMECGDHALALYATDTGLVIAGVVAVISVEGSVRFVSGPTDWTMIDTTPPSGWTDPAFDDSSWHIPEVCADTSPWGATPQPFYDLGASWIWWSTDCRNLGEAWLRLNFTVP